MNFIRTSFEETAEMLRNLGFTELAKDGKFFVFLNDKKAVFNEIDKKKMVLTNKMNM